MSLRALGLDDVSVIQGGPWKNAISLGYFLRQENAQRRKQDLESRGFQPRIRVSRQSEPRYWLDYEQPPGSELLAIDMNDRPNDFMQRAMPCSEEAQPIANVAQVEAEASDTEPVIQEAPGSVAATVSGEDTKTETVEQPTTENEGDSQPGEGDEDDPEDDEIETGETE